MDSEADRGAPTVKKEPAARGQLAIKREPVVKKEPAVKSEQDTSRKNGRTTRKRARSEVEVDPAHTRLAGAGETDETIHD